MIYRTYKLWRLRPGKSVTEVEEFVRERIVPHYRRLSARVDLALELVEDSDSVLAIQIWPSKATFDQVVNAAHYAEWLADYGLTLREWDLLVQLETEWATNTSSLREPPRV